MISRRRVDYIGKTVRYCAKTWIGVIIENFNEETHIVSKLMERQVVLKKDFTKGRCVEKKAEDQEQTHGEPQR